MSAAAPHGRWAAKASRLYDDAYARRYRAHDEQLAGTKAYEAFVNWLGEVCRRFAHPIDVLDLGCGTGRYFWAIDNARSITGLDASAAMLAEAGTPVRGRELKGPAPTLVCGDLLTCELPAHAFDLVYSIGVLAEHTPLDAAVVARVAAWTRPGGRFAFTTVHPDSRSVPRTPVRRVATALLPIVPAAAREVLARRLMAGGLYADEAWIRRVLSPAFVIESLTTMESEAHLHCLCVARKAGA